MILTRDLPRNRVVEAIGNPLLKARAGAAFGAARGSDTMTDLLWRGGEIAAENRRIRGFEGRRSARTGRDESEREAHKDAVSPEKLNAEYGHLGITFDQPTSADAARLMADAKKAENIRNDVITRGPLWASLTGGFAAMATDPLEVASSFVPVVSPARMAWLTGRLGRIGGRAATGVIEGAVGNAVTEPIYFASSVQQQLDYGMTDALLNIGFGAVFGGTIGTAAGIAARRTPEIPDIRADFTPEERSAALKLAVGQTAQSKPIDVRPAIDLNVRRPRTTMEALQTIGVRDDGGDLAAMGVPDWDKAQVGKRNVIQKEGVGRDEAARALWERGYLREQPEAEEMYAAQRGGVEPDLTRAMDRAISEEMAGEPRYSQYDQGDLVDFQAAQAAKDMAERKKALRDQFPGLPDERLDQMLGVMDRFGYSAEEAKTITAIAADPEGFAARQSRVESDGFDQPEWIAEDTLEAEDAMLKAEIDDLDMPGWATKELDALDEAIKLGTARREVAHAAAACAS